MNAYKWTNEGIDEYISKGIMSLNKAIDTYAFMVVNKCSDDDELVVHFRKEVDRISKALAFWQDFRKLHWKKRFSMLKNMEIDACMFGL